MLIAVGLGVWLARSMGQRVLSSVRELNDAIALGKGEAVALPRVQFKEAEAVGAVRQRAGANAMQRAQLLAQHDSLTELPNRLLFDEAVVRALSQAARKQQTLGVLALDLDGFKAVNDSLGHAMGDAALKGCLNGYRGIRGSDVVARLGGDEFVVLLTDVSPVPHSRRPVAWGSTCRSPMLGWARHLPV